MIRVETPNPSFSGVRLQRFQFRAGVAEVESITDEERAAFARLGYQVIDPEPTTVPEGTPLPEDFPGRAELETADVTTVEQVESITDEELDQVDGIGPATIARIRAALATE